MSNDAPMSVSEFHDALEDLVRAYATHLEPTAQVDLTSLRVEASGEGFNVVMAQYGDKPPEMQLNLVRRSDADEPQQDRKFFR